MKIILNKKIRKTRVYMLLTLAAIFYSVGAQVFVSAAGIFPSGLGAFAIAPTYVWKELTNYFTLLYLAFNIPFIIFFWNKNKKKFMWRTLYFLVVQALVGLLTLIPSIKELINDPLQVIVKDKVSKGTTERAAQRAELWPIVVSAIIGGVFVGLSMAISWKYGGSSGGTDIIAYYLSTKKKADVSLTLFITSLVCLITSMGITLGFADGIKSHWVMALFSSFMYIIINSSVVNFIYPKYKKVKMTIVSDDYKNITKHWKENKFNHAWQTQEFLSGYTGQKKYKIIVVIYLLETRQLIREIKTKDSEAWIHITPVRSVFGHLDSSRVENTN